MGLVHSANNEIEKLRQKVTDLENKLELIQYEKMGNSCENREKDYEYLVFSGGGIKGIAYVGALGVLEEQIDLKKIKGYAGASAGSMFASFIAVGYTSSELLNIMKDTDFSKFLDNKYGIPGEIYNFIEDYGVCKGDMLYNFVGDLIEKKTGNKDYSIEDLYNDTGKTLVIVATDINRKKSIYFHPKNPVEEYRKIPIRYAVRFSASIPFVFEAKELSGDYIADGGVLDNYPLHVFDGKYPGDPEARLHLVPPNPKTLGLNIIAKSELSTVEDDNREDIKSLEQYCISYIDMILAENERRLLTPDFFKRSIIIPTNDYPITDFKLAEKEQMELFMLGKNKAIEFFLDK